MDAISERLKGKKVLILGFGREGRSSLAFIRKNIPVAEIAVADKNAAALVGLDVKSFSGEHYLDVVNDYDIVVKTPGISLKNSGVDAGKITSQTDLFLEEFHAQIIGVTGTKGKSTTSSLIYHLIHSSGKKAFLVGNIGVPVFDIVEKITRDSIVVFELSAHQLQFIHRSPHVGILLNIFEEHLDHFGTFEAYSDAKKNIVAKMGADDWAVTNAELSNFVSQIPHVVNYESSDFDVDWSEMPLKGGHNKNNVMAALCACKAFGFPVKELLPYLFTFKPLEHRMEFVGTFKGVSFYNDSISTIPQATIAANETISGVSFLILGGFDRNIDYSPLVEYLLKKQVPHLLFTGKAGERIMMMLKEKDYDGDIDVFGSLEEAFDVVRQKSSVGDVCLLSPAAASYDRYKNFEERGSMFKSLARNF
ncbi:MAG: UDP-N-acetylmuramoyl-L-alanine--D-glutamate ligase [Candidatus Limimorpha sp.]